MPDTALRLALAPLLLAQALYVRRGAQRLPEAAGPRDGQGGAPGNGPDLHLRIIGDSSAAGVGAPEQSQALAGQLAAELSLRFHLHWHLDAISGATTRSTLARLADRTPARTDVVITALGVNDVTRLTRPGVWLRDQRRLWDRIRTLYAPRRIYVSGLPPFEHFPLLPNPLRWTLARQARAMQGALQDGLAQVPDVTLVPFTITPHPALSAEDGFHPAPALYTLWAKEMASRITSDWPV